MGRTSFCMRCGRSLGWRRRDIIVVYVDDVFVRLAPDGLVPLILYFRDDLISALIIFYCRHFHFGSSCQTKSIIVVDLTCTILWCCYDTVFPVIHPPPAGGFATDIDNESHDMDPIAFTFFIAIVYAVARQPHVMMAIDTTLVHLHWEMNHHLRLFLNRWSRSCLWRLPVQSLTVVNARLIDL